MQLILNTFGAYLYKSGDLFEIKVDDEKKRISPKKVQSVVITTGATLSTDAIQVAAIVVLSHNRLVHYSTTMLLWSCLNQHSYVILVPIKVP